MVRVCTTETANGLHKRNVGLQKIKKNMLWEQSKWYITWTWFKNCAALMFAPSSAVKFIIFHLLLPCRTRRCCSINRTISLMANFWANFGRVPGKIKPRTIISRMACVAPIMKLEVQVTAAHALRFTSVYSPTNKDRNSLLLTNNDPKTAKPRDFVVNCEYNW